MSASIRITKGATDISSLIDWKSVDLVSVLSKEKGTLTFDVLAPKAPTLPTNIPNIADTIYLYNTTNVGSEQKLFGGTVTGREIVNDGGILLRYKISCQDWGFSFDAKLVKKNYSNMDPKDIVVDIVSHFAGAGFTTANVQKGNFLVTTVKYNYEQPTKCIEHLANQIGWEWYIDPNKDLHFFPPNAVLPTAPFTIDDTSGHINWPTLDVDIDLANMKNSIYVIGGTYVKTFADPPGAVQFSPIDIYTSVAGTFVYPLAYPYDISTMVVKLAGVPQTLGTDQQTDPSSVQCLYNGTGVFIRFTSDPGAGHTIEVTGNARIPILAHISNGASIATYGEYQDSIIDSQIKSVQEAQERAFADITQFGNPVYDVKFETIDDLANQLYIGQSIQLNSTIYGANKLLVIKRIEARGYTPTKLIFSVECMGSDVVSFTDIMLFLLQQNNAQTDVADSTVLQVLVDEAETLAVTDAVSATSGTSPYQWGPSSPQARWGFARWG